MISSYADLYLYYVKFEPDHAPFSRILEKVRVVGASSPALRRHRSTALSTSAGSDMDDDGTNPFGNKTRETTNRT